MRAGGGIAHGQRLCERPVLADVAAMIHNAAQRVLKPHAIVRLLANLHVGQQAELRAAPVGEPPGLREVEAFVAGRRIALRHVAHHVPPDFARGQQPVMHAGDRLNIGREAFFDPMMIVLLGRKGRMHHLVRHHPVAVQIVRCGVLADAHAREGRIAAHIAPCGALQHPLAARSGHNQNAVERYRKTPVVGRDRAGGILHPVEHLRRGKVERPGGEIHLNHRTVDAKCGGMRYRGAPRRTPEAMMRGRPLLRPADRGHGEQRKQSESERQRPAEFHCPVRRGIWAGVHTGSRFLSAWQNAPGMAVLSPQKRCGTQTCCRSAATRSRGRSAADALAPGARAMCPAPRRWRRPPPCAAADAR